MLYLLLPWRIGTTITKRSRPGKKHGPVSTKFLEPANILFACKIWNSSLLFFLTLSFIFLDIDSWTAKKYTKQMIFSQEVSDKLF